MGQLADTALRTAINSVRMREESLADIHKIDTANNNRTKGSRLVAKPAVSKQTERERITVHDIAAGNPLLRGILRRMG